MTARPTRATTAGRAYLDLQNLARRQHRPTDELHQIYALEGFLTRLAASPYADRLVLKGGVLLAAYDTRRPTRDVDLQGQRISNDTDTMLDMVRGIAGIAIDDGLTFDVDRAIAENIREEDVYTGVRVSLTAELAAARLALHVDINVGDPIWPAPQQVVLPRLLAGEIVLNGYPLPMVHAEKLVTAVQRGVANTRWRDFADIYLLARRHDIDGYELSGAIAQVVTHRQTHRQPLKVILDGYSDLAQRRWTAWRRKHRLDDRLPEQFGQVLETVTKFADPALAGEAGGQIWDAAQGTWRTKSPSRKRTGPP